MPLREQARAVVAVAWLGLLGCQGPAVTVEPSERPPARPMPALSSDDEALLASLSADDPSDFHVARARIWRIGAARWSAGGPEFAARPSEARRAGALEQPIEVVVVDEAGPRVLLPLDDLERGSRAPSWSALRLVAVVGPGDLVTGLARELHPTPWLTLAAGIGLTPLGREDDHLRVRWSDPACGFGLELEIDTKAFGPLYEPGPSGRPTDEPELDEATTLRLAPGTQIYADANGREPIVRLDPNPARESERLSAAQRVRLLGKPKRARQHIELRCRGVMIEGYVAVSDLVELPGRYAVVESSAPPNSSCAGFDGEPITVSRGTMLFEPGPRSPKLIGTLASDVELPARPIADGWWQSCVPSPWGDLVFDFHLR